MIECMDMWIFLIKKLPERMEEEGGEGNYLYSIEVRWE